MAEKRRRRRLAGLPTWMSAGAAVLSAMVGVAALAISMTGDGSDLGRSDGSDTSVVDAPAETIPAAIAPIAAPRQGDEVEVTIDAIRYFGPELDGPGYEFRGSADLDDETEVRVLARPVTAVTTTTSGPVLANSWIVSAPATFVGDSEWAAQIGLPPLTGDSFDFAAVAVPVTRGASVFAQPLSTSCGFLGDKGVDHCDVIGATSIARYEE